MQTKDFSISQSISRYVLIAYYVQRQFTRNSRWKAWPSLHEAFLKTQSDGLRFPNSCIPRLPAELGKMQVLIQEG